MLAYYLRWRFKARLARLFAEQTAGLTDNTLQAKDRTLTLASVSETLKSHRRSHPQQIKNHASPIKVQWEIKNLAVEHASQGGQCPMNFLQIKKPRTDKSANCQPSY